MNAAITHLPVWEAWKRSNQTTVLVACEDIVTSARVNEFCQDFHHLLGQNCRDAKAVWLFTQLRVPNLRAIAADEAAATDVVLISAHPAQGLPEEAKTWIDLWIGRKHKRATLLVALLDGASQTASDRLKNYLQETAARGKMDFVVQLAV